MHSIRVLSSRRARRAAEGVHMPKEPSAVKTRPPLAAALVDLIQHKQHDQVLIQFTHAYRLRQKYSWLGEFRADGLAYALKYALVTYVPARARIDDPRVTDEHDEIES